MGTTTWRSYRDQSELCDKMDNITDLLSEEEMLPDGDMFPMNLRRIKPIGFDEQQKLQNCQPTCLTEETQQLIEGRLEDLQYQAQNVQVIIQGKDDEAAMFLVNDMVLLNPL